MLGRSRLRCAARVLVFAVCSLSGGWSMAAAGEVRVAVATNFRVPLEELRPDFEKQTGHHLKLSAGSTGKLYAQIRLGSPFHVFMAADQERPQKLVDEGLAVPGSTITYARGQLTLWAKDWDGPLSADSLVHPKVSWLAIASPELAPYGRAAMDLLHALGVLENLTGKLAMGENVGQAFAFVQTQNAQLGLVALSQVLQYEDGLRGQRWDPPSDLYGPILQDAVLLDRARENPAAIAFMAFLASPETRSRVASMGYLP